MGSTQYNPYGTPGGDQVVYTIADVHVGDLVEVPKLDEIRVNVDAERSRRGFGAGTYPTFVDDVDAADLTSLADGLNSAGFTGGFSGVSPGDDVEAFDCNAMIDKLQAAGAECLCNCNYCTCNCNYCTCNCNYCTCVCAYCTCDCNHCICDCDYCTCDCNYCTCDCNYCTCDCNYCACDCNYCTCNCNYACTCNCAY